MLRQSLCLFCSPDSLQVLQHQNIYNQFDLNRRYISLAVRNRNFLTSWALTESFLCFWFDLRITSGFRVFTDSSPGLCSFLSDNSFDSSCRLQKNFRLNDVAPFIVQQVKPGDFSKWGQASQQLCPRMALFAVVSACLLFYEHVSWPRGLISNTGYTGQWPGLQCTHNQNKKQLQSSFSF